MKAFFTIFSLAIASFCSSTALAQTVAVNEFLAGNTFTNFDKDGEASDWLELHNYGSNSVDLTGFSLTDEAADPRQWILPDIVLAPGAYLLIWASGKDLHQDELHTNFKLSKQAEFIGLYDAGGAPVDEFDFGPQLDDISSARWPEGTGPFSQTTTATPGAMNIITAGSTDPPVFINEILAGNQMTNVDEDGDASDWLELYNAGNDSVNLLGFTLTDDQSQPAQWVFPEVILPPHDFLLVWASGKNRSGPQLHTNFKLSASGEFLGLYYPDGQIVDATQFGVQQDDIALARIPDGSGDFELTAKPTPGAANQLQIPGRDLLTFSPASGFFQNSVDVVLSSSAANGAIRYTTNGAAVTPASPNYQAPIRLTATTVLRARAFDGNVPLSEDVSQIYLVNYPGHLPVLSLATADSNLNGENGIFSNFIEEGDAWERPISVNLLEPDGTGFQINAGVRVHGSHSRPYPKKSMRLYFRSDYGQSKLRYRLFEQKDLQQFDQLVVHSGGSLDQIFGGQEWTLARDPLNHTLWAEFGGVVSAHRPVILYINGRIWGIYMLRERINDDYLVQNYGLTNPDLLEWTFNETPEIKAGDLTAWNEMLSFFKNNEIDSDAKLEQIRAFMDLQNFIDYNLLEIFIGHKDWPHNNSFFFRERALDGKWRWILWDTESTFRNNRINMLQWVTRDTVRTDISEGDSAAQLFATIFMRKLVKNAQFNREFVSRFADILNTTLRPEHLREIFNSIIADIEPDLPLELERWQGDISGWNTGLATVNEFIDRRDAIQWNQLRRFFGLGQRFNLTVDVAQPGAGTVRVNSLTHTDLPWSGQYFDSLAVQAAALPAPGFRFSHWSGASSSQDSIVTLDLNSDLTLIANFEIIPEPTVHVHSFTPAQGQPGSRVTISGQKLASVVRVRFGGRQALILDGATDSEMQVLVPFGAQSGVISVVTASDSVASATSFEVLPHTAKLESLVSDDAFIDAAEPEQNFGDSRQLLVNSVSGSEKMAFFRFDLPDGSQPFSQTLLRFCLLESSSHGGQVYLVQPDWTEDSIHWTNAPALNDPVGEFGSAAKGDFIEIDLGGYSSPGSVFAVVVTAKASSSFSISSKEGFYPAIISLEPDSTVTAVSSDIFLPKEFALRPAYPNPFNAGTKIEYELPQAAHVRLIIYNLMGQVVRTLVDMHQSSGVKQVSWDGRDATGCAAGSGIYFVRLTAGEKRFTQKILLQK